MALDPRIALGVQPVQIQSPLEMANQIAGLRAAEQRNAFTQMQMRQAERALTQENELRRRVSAPGFFKDPNALATLTSEFGAPGAELFAAYGQGRKAMTEADAATAKVANDNYGRFQKVIGDFAYGEETPTKDKVLSRVDMLIKQGIIAPEFGDYARNILPDDPKQLQASLQDQFLSQVPVEERARLFVPMSPEVAAQKANIAREGAARTTILPAGKKFGETLGEKAALRLDDFRTKAESARRTLNLSDRLRPLLNDPAFISGTLAEKRTAAARAFGMDVAATEAFFAGIGGEVAERITQFGAGTGLSDADRTYAKKIAGGEETFSKEGIEKIMRINEETARDMVRLYGEERTRLAKKEPEVLDYYPDIKIDRAVRRTGKVGNRRVIEYTDGSLEYAD
jgi:hypothetical protein